MFDPEGWPDANNDEGAPMPGRDWAFILVILWAVVATVFAVTGWL